MIWLAERYTEGRNPIAPMDFAEYLRKSGVSDNSKVYYDRFLPNGLHERHCYSKSRWNVQYLEVC